MRSGTRLTLVGVIALAVMVGVFAARPWLLDRAEFALLDWRFQFRGVESPQAPVTVVAIDSRSIDELGHWPWNRSVIAELVDRLTQSGAAAIGLDFVLSEPETPPEVEAMRIARQALAERGDDDEEIALLDRAIREADRDGLLAAAIERSERLVLGYFFRTGLGEEDDPDRIRRALRAVRRSKVAVAKAPVESLAPILTCTGVEPNIPRLHEAARHAGFFSALLDGDGVLRRAPLVARCGGEFYVSLALAILQAAVGQRSVLIGDAEGLRQVRLGDTVFDTDEGSRILINYRGPPGTFPYVSATDVIHGRVDLEGLAGSVVLVGPTEVGLRDLQTTPFSSAMPGVEVHANLLDNLISGEIIRRHDLLTLVELVLLLAIGGVLILVVPRIGSAAYATGFAVLLAILLVAGCVYAFEAHGQWVNMAYPLATLASVYLTLFITRSITVEVAGRRIRRAFATYVPPEVVNEMVRKPESFRLSGERRDLSILFSDVRDFTSLSEKLGAENVTKLMNEYLTPMTRIVFESRGTLDKYIGDAMMAFWGAPLNLDDHPVRACEAALAMQRELGRLRSERQDLAGVEALRVGIGIHSAEVIVGNLGSELRFDYTVTGDGVNVCSRLEGLTKYYGAIVASSDLVERLPPGFLVRELDTVRVKGKRESLRIFEVMGRRDAEPGERDVLAAYAAGLAAYRAARWSDAELAFDRARKLQKDGDVACDTLLARIGALKQEPPGDWDGVWSFDTK